MIVSALFATTAVRADPTDVRLRVVLYPAIIVLPNDEAHTKPRFTAGEVREYLLKGVRDKIAPGNTLYSVCVYDLAKFSADCDPTNANVLITTQFTPDPKSKDAAHPDWLVTMRSLDMINGRVITTLALGPLTEAALAGDATAVATALANLVPKASDITTLLGTAAIRNNRLSLFQGYEPYLQLVPTLADSNQPTYLSLMANLLDRRGLPSVPSQFNAGVVASGNTPLDAICGRGQRYLVYNLWSEEYPHQVSLSTRIQTHASAELYDCTTMSVIPVALDQHANVPTTKGPLTSILSIIHAAFFWQVKEVSPVPLTVIGLVSPFVDAVPGSDAVRRSVADRALQGLVDRLCTRLDAVPTPAPSPKLGPLAVLVAPTPDPQAIAVLERNLLRAKAERDAAKNAVRSAGTKETKKAAQTVLKAKNDAFNQAVSALVAVLSGASDGARVVTKLAGADTTPVAQTGAALVSLDVSGFLSATPPSLKCRPHTKLDRSSSGSAADSTRWKRPE